MLQAAEASRASTFVSSFNPTADDYYSYARNLQEWITAVQDHFFVDFVFANAGGAPAEGVEVILEMPAALKPGTALPTKPREPSRRTRPDLTGMLPISSTRTSIQPRPDRIIGPSIVKDDASDRVWATWEIPKLYHDRPLYTRSKVELKYQKSRTNLVISGSGLRTVQDEEDGRVRLHYTVRAANVPETLRGVLILK